MSDGMFRTVSGLQAGIRPGRGRRLLRPRTSRLRAGPGRRRWPARTSAASRSTWCAAGTSPAAVDAALDRLEARVRGPVPRGVRRDAGSAGVDGSPERAGPHAVRPPGPSRRGPVRRRRTVGSRATSRPTSTTCASASSPTSTRARRSSAAEVRSATFRRRKGRNALRRGPGRRVPVPRGRGAPRRRVSRTRRRPRSHRGARPSLLVRADLAFAAGGCAGAPHLRCTQVSARGVSRPRA